MPCERDLTLGLRQPYSIGCDGAQGGSLAAMPLDPEQLAMVSGFAFHRGADSLEPELILLAQVLGATGLCLATAIYRAGFQTGARAEGER